MRKRLSVVTGILLILTLVACQEQSQKTDVTMSDKPNETREWVVKWHGDPSQDFLETVEILRQNEDENTMLVQVKESIDQEKWRAKWILVDEVEYIQPNFQYKINTANSERIGEELTGIEPGAPAHDYFLERSNVRRAWEVWEPVRSVTIAVIDTGVDTQNPLIAPHLVKQTNIVYPGAGADDVTVEDVRLPEEQGKSEAEIQMMYEGDYLALADYESRMGVVGHGTSVTSVLLQTLGLIDGEEPVAATETTAKIMPIKVMGFTNGEKEGGSDFDMTEAIRRAVNRGADIITLSLGDWAYSKNARDAVAMAEQAGVLVVAAAGNWQNGVNEPIFYPAAFPNVLAVGGVTASGEYDEQSNRGMGLDIVAPNEHILTLNVGGEYRYMDGNSFATPQVTAVAAMIMQQQPQLSPSQVRQLLRQTSKTGEGGWDKETGYGHLDAYRAITEWPEVDIYENNDNQEAAATISVNDRIEAVLSSEDEEDWYLLSIPDLGDSVAYQMRVNVKLPRSLRAGVELLVKRPGERQLVSYSLHQTDDVLLTVEQGEVYLALRFQKGEPSRYLAYELETELVPAPDIYEDNDQQWHAYDLEVKDELFIEGTLHKEGDTDWFRIHTPEAGNLSFALMSSTPRMDLMLFVQRLGGSGVLVDEVGPMEPENLQIRVEAGGDYYVRITDLNISPVIGKYQLWVNYEPIVSDANEPNDRSDLATVLPGPEIPVSAALTDPLDIDWYRFSVLEATDVTLFVEGMSEQVQAQISLYDDDLSAIGQQTIVADKEERSWTRRLAEGDYYVRVRRLSGAETTPYMIGYSLPEATQLD